MQILDERNVAEVVEGPVTVVKTALDLGREGVSGVRLTVQSSASDPVTVRVEEEFPGHVSMSDVQVHPSYGPNRWTISEQAHRMVFEDEIPPAGTSMTIYGVRITHDGALDPFLGGPTVTVDATDDAVSDDADASESDTESGEPSSDPSPPAGEEPSEPSTEPDPTGRDGPVHEGEPRSDGEFVYGEERREPSSSTDPEPDGTEPPGSADFVETLIERTARAELTDAQRQALREALDLGPEPSQRIQLEDLQSSVTRLAAFADDYEALVDSVGRPADAIEALEASVEQLAVTVEELTAANRAGRADHEELRERVDGLERDFRELRADQSGRVDDLDDRLAELEAVLEADEFAAIREVIEAERTWRERASASRSSRPKSTSGTPAN